VLLLVALAARRPFQNYLDGKRMQTAAREAEAKRQALLRSLPVQLQQRLIELHRRSHKLLETSEQTDPLVAESNRGTIQHLEEVYLQLLQAKNNLAGAHIQDTADQVDSDLAKIEGQVELLLRNAALETEPSTITSDIEMESRLPNAGRTSGPNASGPIASK
jgi:hypothetical protein